MKNLKIIVLLTLIICASLAFAQSKAPTVQVELNAADLGPRAIEDLTSKSVPRDYGFAWQTMAQALDQNRLDLINGYFTGFAKANLTDRIKQQIKNDLHVRYTDHGHKLTAIFYSPNGDVMQLRDDAQFEIQVLDGDKLIHSEPAHLQYMVLMTPGADRWLVRDLQAVPTKESNTAKLIK